MMSEAEEQEGQSSTLDVDNQKRAALQPDDVDKSKNDEARDGEPDETRSTTHQQGPIPAAVVRSRQVDTQLAALAPARAPPITSSRSSSAKASSSSKNQQDGQETQAHKKERMLESLARRRESAVELLVKESMNDVAAQSQSPSQADMTRIEEEVEARIMRKLLQERQQYILRDESSDHNNNNEEEAKAEVEEATNPTTTRRRPRQPTRQLELPTSIPHQAKIAPPNAALMPGAVRVAGMDAHDTSTSMELTIGSGSSQMMMMQTPNDDEENPMDRSSMTTMQLPQPTVPEYFEQTVMLEATLVTSSHHRRKSKLTNSMASGTTNSSRMIVEAKPLPEEYSSGNNDAANNNNSYTDLQCRDVVRSKKLCSRIVLSIVVIIGILLAIILPLSRNRTEKIKAYEEQEEASQQEPFQSDLSQQILQGIEVPNSPQNKANSWILGDPNFDSYSEERQRQRYSLAAFYFSTKGDEWFRNDNWLSYDADECTEWYWSHAQNTSCDDQGRLVTLNLTNNNLDGSFSKAMYLLPYVKILDISNNKVFGTLPPLSFSTLQMEVVDLSNNLLYGALTAEFGFSNTALRVLRYRGNQLTGNFLSSLGQLAPNIVEFDGTDNLYDGEIPEGIGLLSKLEVVRFGYNDIRGTLPSEIGMLHRLRVIECPATAVSGTVPPQIESLQQLESIDWSNTNITGELPEALCNLEATGQLELSVDCDQIECCPQR